MAKRATAPDWRDPADYAHLIEMQRPAFAWELLRRNPDYRRTAPVAARLHREEGGILFTSPLAARLAAPWGLEFLRNG